MDRDAESALVANATGGELAALVRRAQAGSADATDALVARFFPVVFAVALARVRNSDDADDLAQEVFLRAHLFLHRLDTPEAYPGWLLRMARNLTIDWQRAGAARTRLAAMVPLDDAHADVPDPAAPDARTSAEATRMRRILHGAVSQLPPDKREIVLLHYINDMTQDEIATRLGVHRTTVGRVLTRSLSDLRTTLTREMPGAADLPAATRTALRPTSQVAHAVIVRSAVALAALSAAQKSALAATPALSKLSLDAMAATATSKSSAAGLATALQSIGLLSSSGGTAVMAGKGLVVGVVAVAAIGAGVYYVSDSQSQHTPRTTIQESQSLGESLIPPAKTSWRTYASWDEHVEEYLKQNPQNTGLRDYAAAMKTMDTKSVLDATADIRKITANGWSGATPLVENALAKNSRAMALAYEASKVAPFLLPPAEDSTTPMPNFLYTQNFIRLFTIHAQKLTAAGRADESARTSIAAVKLGESFRGPGLFLVNRMIGIACVAMASNSLSAALTADSMTSSTASEIAQEISKLEAQRLPVSEAFRSEARIMFATMQRQSSDQELRKKMKPEELKMADTYGADPAYRTEADKVYREFANIYDKPAHERKKVDITQLTDNVILKASLPNMDEMAVRDDVANARLRLCRALALLACGRNTEAESLLDIFAPAPITIAPDKIYSVGPDGTSQQGQLIFDPTNGTVSAGDIVIPR